MQFGIAAGKPQGIAFRKRLVGQRRKEHHSGAHGAQGVEVGGVDEAQCGITCDGDGLAFQKSGQRLKPRMREVDAPVLPAGNGGGAG